MFSQVPARLGICGTILRTREKLREITGFPRAKENAPTRTRTHCGQTFRDVSMGGESPQEGEALLLERATRLWEVKPANMHL